MGISLHHHVYYPIVGAQDFFQGFYQPFDILLYIHFSEQFFDWPNGWTVWPHEYMVFCATIALLVIVGAAYR